MPEPELDTNQNRKQTFGNELDATHAAPVASWAKSIKIVTKSSCGQRHFSWVERKYHKSESV